MIENRYKEVRMLLRNNKIEKAEEVHAELAKIANRFSNEDKYWFYLLTSEIKRKKNEYQSAKDDIQEALLLSQEIALNDMQKSSLHGRMAIIQYRLENYTKARSLFDKTLSFLSDDLGRQNYYRQMLCNCYIKLNDEEGFSQSMKAGLNDIIEGQLEKYWNSNLDFVWEITWLTRHPPWSEIVTKALSVNFRQYDKITQGFLEYFRARLARYQLDQKKFLIHMQNSVELCTSLNPENFISLSFNFVGMLQLFGEYQRAKNILIKCLEKIPDLSPKRIHILNTLGSISRFSGEYDLSIQYLKKSLEINQIIHDVWQEAYTHNTLGMVYTLTGDTEKATEHYESSLRLSKKSNDFYGLGFTYGALGWLESNQGNLIQAKRYYESSISTFEEKTTVPAIILLAYAELLSRMENEYSYKINDLIKQARSQIWTQQKRLDFGRYYNTLGNIALNQKKFDQALREFSLALEYCDSFEVETQTLLGIIKTNLELFLDSPTNFEYLDKVKLFLNDVKSAAESSAFILGEVELIMGIIEMHSQNYQDAVKRFDTVLKLAQEHNYPLLGEKVQKQRETLQILETHDQLQKVTSIANNHELKRSSIREAIDYLTELTKLLGTQTKENNP
ncbi:MAG: tetratricopeptide repeat protein [Candidatus Heimdallarchaeota archaeon]|nr:MAG: tetratricopeptide repeat protein [Candidatus Heimdallarchaeota archaeon]